MTAAVFVDSNVIVYARDAREAAKQPIAAAWLEHLWQQRTGRTSMQVLSEFYVTATRKLRPAISADDAWDDVQALLRWSPQPTDAYLLERARLFEARHRLSWWDAMIVAAAHMQGCSLLLSEDMHDGAVFDGVTVRSPFTLGVSEPRVAYMARPASAIKHRAPGRPKRSAGASL
jgi:predicted nucleic acid-binding protein